MTQYTGADSLVPFLTAGSEGGQQSDPRQSLGGWSSTFRAALHGFRVVSGIGGLQIDWVSPTCGTGAGVITAVSDDYLTFSPPGGAQGAPVQVANGQTRLLPGADPTRYVIVSRYLAGALRGTSTLELGSTWRNVLCGSDVPKTAHAGGTRRCHMVLLRSMGSLACEDIRIWTKALGPEKQILQAHAGLPASGAGRIKLPSTDEWPPYLRYVLITDSGGDTSDPKEICCGYIDGHEFVVPAAGRGVYGKGPAASADGDVVWPYSGVRLAGETTPSGSIPGTWPIADEASTPAGVTWRYGLGYYNGTPWTLPASDQTRLGVWVYLEIPAGYRCSAIVPASLCWRFTQQDATGARTTYWCEAMGFRRWAEDLSAERYLVFRSVDGAPFDYERPLASAAARPIDVAVVDDAVNALELWMQNDWGLRYRLGSATFTLSSGSSVADPPIPPENLAVAQTAASQIDLSAIYRTALDPDPGDTFEIDIENLTTSQGNVQTSRNIGPGAIAYLSETFTDAVNWADGDQLQVTLTVKRSGDAAESSALTATVTLDNTAPAAPSDADVLIHDRKDVIEE